MTVTEHERGHSLVLYDAECGLCMWLLAGLLRWDRGGRLESVALQTPRANELLHDLTPERQLASWHVITTRGIRYSAGAALAPLLRLLPGGSLPAAALSRAPALTDRLYASVASNRRLLARLVPDTSKRRGASYLHEREARRSQGR